MINLINNSFDAVMETEGERKIEIQVIKDLQNRVIIKVLNNGPLIPPGLLEKIFVPFLYDQKEWIRNRIEYFPGDNETS